MKLIDKDKIAAEIEKRYEYWREKEFNAHSIESEIRMSECQHLMLLLNNIEIKEVNLEKTKWSPSKKQMESLKDMLKYNIGEFDYQKFMEVNSLYEDLTNSKLFDETDKQK